MTDNELLLAISNIMDKKIRPLEKRMDSLEKTIVDTKNELKNDIRRIDITVENNIQKSIDILSENYLPAAKRFEKTSDTIEAMQADIDTLKKVVIEHSEKLQKIS